MRLANTYTNELLFPYHLRPVLVPVASLDPLVLIPQVMSVVVNLRPGVVVVLVVDLALLVADSCQKLSFQTLRELDCRSPPDFRLSVLATFFYKPHCLRARRADSTVVFMLYPSDVIMQTVAFWIHWASRYVCHPESCRSMVIWPWRAGSISFPVVSWISLGHLIRGFGTSAGVGHPILLIVFPNLRVLASVAVPDR